MENARQFLLSRIAGYETNGLEDMGEFNAKHFQSVAKIMKDFAEESIITTVNMLADGGPVDIGNGKILQLEFQKRKKK